LTFGVVVEGVFDAAALPEFIRKCVGDDVEIEVRLCSGSVMRKFPGVLEGFRHIRSGLPVSKALIIRDADTKNPDTLITAMQARYASRSYAFPVEPIVIVQELETWLLADSAALTHVCNRAVPTVQGALEAIVDPKVRLRRLLSEAKIAYTPAMARKIAAAITLESLAYRCPSFQRFRQALGD